MVLIGDYIEEAESIGLIHVERQELSNGEEGIVILLKRSVKEAIEHGNARLDNCFTSMSKRQRFHISDESYSERLLDGDFHENRTKTITQDSISHIEALATNLAVTFKSYLESPNNYQHYDCYSHPAPE